MANSIFGSIGGGFMGLCCAGTPFILAFLTSIGLSFLINDFILFPLLFLGLWFMFKSIKKNKKKYSKSGPMNLGIISVIILLIGIFKPTLIWLGVIGLIVSSIWDNILIKKW
jgi:hypothetical protein